MQRARSASSMQVLGVRPEYLALGGKPSTRVWPGEPKVSGSATATPPDKADGRIMRAVRSML